MRRILAAAVLIGGVLTMSSHAAPESTLAREIENRGDATAITADMDAPRVIRAQILLDRARFSPGQIDGRYGGDMIVAVKGYQQTHSLRADGVIGPEAWRSLNADTRPLLTTYRITA